MAGGGAVTDLAQGGGLPLLPLYRSDRWWAVCRTCRKRHPFRPASDLHRAQAYEDFAGRHRGHVVALLSPADVERLARRTEARRRARGDSVLHYAGNADVKLAFQAADQSLTITALNSLANSATAGWGSEAIDNSANLYLDYLTAIKLAAVNTAPASDKVFYVFTATALNTTDLPNTGASGVLATTQAALTFPNVSTGPCNLPLLQAVPYITQNVAIQTPLFSTARAFGGLIGPYLWYALVNFSGMTIAATGNAWKVRGVYATVV
jgi:hypothetical protein